MTRRGGLAGLAAFAAGVGAGVLAEEVLYRRVFARPDPEAEEPLGTLRGERIDVAAPDGTSLHAEAFGPLDGPGLVLCHGFTLRADVWHYQVRDLAADGRWRVVTYDTRGHGRSGSVRSSGLSPSVLAGDLEAVLHQTRVRPAVVVGHSMGGITVQALGRFGQRYPEEVGEHVRGLVLINTTYTGAFVPWGRAGVRYRRLQDRIAAVADRAAAGGERLERLRFRATDLAMFVTRFGFGRNPSPAHVAFTRRMIERTPNATFAAGLGGIVAFDGHDGLEKLDIPVLVVAGSRDLLTPAWLSEEMAARIPESELVVIDGAGHMSMLERHAQVTDLLRAFCERVLA